jgi:hypothetical protein
MDLPRFCQIAIASIGALLPFEALAHGGHLGDLAGHSHWIGWGALVAGAALAALLGKRKEKQETAEDSEPAGEPEAEPASEEQSP